MLDFTRSVSTLGAYRIENLRTKSPPASPRASLTLGATPLIGKMTPPEPSMPTSAEWLLRF